MRADAPQTSHRVLSLKHCRCHWQIKKMITTAKCLRPDPQIGSSALDWGTRVHWGSWCSPTGGPLDCVGIQTRGFWTVGALGSHQRRCNPSANPRTCNNPCRGLSSCVWNLLILRIRKSQICLRRWRKAASVVKYLPSQNSNSPMTLFTPATEEPQGSETPSCPLFTT